jgi:hypothetical protein
LSVGVALETDTALGISLSKSKAVGVASETETALAIPMPFPLAVSSSGPFLQDAQGQPYLIESEFGWPLLIKLSLSNWNTFLDRCLALSLNAVECWLIDIGTDVDGVVTVDQDGNAPFTTPGDLTTPNAAYFANIEAKLAAARAKNIAILLFVNYLGYGGNCWRPVIAANILANCQWWGTYVGNLCKKYPNVLPMAGGDYSSPNDSTRTKEVAIFTNIRAAGCLQLGGAEWGDPDTILTDQAGYSYGPTPSTSALLNVNTFYGEGAIISPATHGLGETFGTADRALLDYATSGCPPLANEMPQVGGGTESGGVAYYPIDMSRESVRNYLYWARLAGSITGSNGGHTQVANPRNAGTGWQAYREQSLWDHYLDPYAYDRKYLIDWWRSLNWSLMRPSGTTSASPHSLNGSAGGTNYCGTVLIVSGGGSRTTLVVSTMQTDGAKLVVHIPCELPKTTASRTIQVDCRGMSAGTKPARWRDPTTGTYQNATPSTVNNSLSNQSFTTPSGGNSDGANDWLLELG